jgi:hypothetical protein
MWSVAMRPLNRLAISGLILAFFAAPALAQSGPAHVDANGMPTDRSTPAEHAQTESLNRQIQDNNAAADAEYARQKAANSAEIQADQAQYQQQQRQYQNALRRNEAAQRNYQDRTRVYYALRARYARERAAYHRGVWPDRFRPWRLQSDASLAGSRVEILSGARVGTVDSVARSPSGRIDALYVVLDGGKQVWIDEADVRFDRAGRVVMTDLDRADLRAMADERL